MASELTDIFQATEVAHVRLLQAMATLATKKSMMDKIDFGINHLKFFLSVGLSVAEVRGYIYFGVIHPHGYAVAQRNFESRRIHRGCHLQSTRSGLNLLLCIF